MAKLRKWCAYRTMERPYTRWSKARKKAFVKSRPGKKVIKFDMGDLVGGTKQFNFVLQLVSKDMAQVRTNAIEASRITALKRLEGKFGRLGFYFKIKIVPHQVIRENPLAAGAGADRLSTGMKHSFGKIIGTAARVQKGQVVYELYLDKEHENFGRQVLNLAAKKLPLRVTVVGTEKEAVALTEEEIAKAKKAAARGKKADDAKEAAAAEATAEAAEGDAAPAEGEAAPAEEKSE